MKVVVTLVTLLICIGIASFAKGLLPDHVEVIVFTCGWFSAGLIHEVNRS